MSEKETKRVVLAVCMNEDLKAWFKEEAFLESKTMSALCEEFLEAYRESVEIITKTEAPTVETTPKVVPEETIILCASKKKKSKRKTKTKSDLLREAFRVEAASLNKPVGVQPPTQPPTLEEENDDTSWMARRDALVSEVDTLINPDN